VWEAIPEGDDMNNRALAACVIIFGVFLCPCSLSAAGLGIASKTGRNEIHPAIRASIVKGYGNLPLSFEENQGKAHNAVRYLSRGHGYTLFLTSTEAALGLRRESAKRPGEPGGNEPAPTANEVIRLKCIGANPEAKITGIDELPGKSNYFIGNDPAKWRTDVPNYAKVKIEDIYPGIDLVYYGNQRQLEYDWIVKPGADPKVIRFAVEGKASPKLDSQGNLILDEEGEVRLNRPMIYQAGTGSRTEIAGGYVLAGNREVFFKLDKYDPLLPLVIDPVLSYSTFLGGDSAHGYAIAVDSSGNVYVTGWTGSPNFPTTANAFQPSSRGGWDIFITKLNPSGNALVYSTYLGGTGSDYEGGIALDSSGNAYVAGRTESTNFPTVGPFQATGGGVYGDAFVAKLDSSGRSLIFSSYLGGSNYEYGNGIAVDSSRNIYVTGVSLSGDFPTAHPFQASLAGDSAAFIVKIGNPQFKVAVNPAGCRFQVDGITYTNDQYFAWQAGSGHTISVPIPQDTAGTRCVFTGWSDGGPATHMITAPGTTTTYTANFNRLYYLSTSLTPQGGGDIFASPASTDGYYVEGTQVQLTAKPRFGYMFWGWSGHAGGTLNPQTVKMWSPLSVSAHFFAAPSMSVQAGGAATYQTPGSGTVARVGYAIAEVAPGGVTPYGTAVFSFKQNGVTVSEAGVPASPPTTRARIFVEYRNGVYALPGRSEAGLIDIDTGIAVVNPGSVNADVTYTLRDSSGNTITTGHGVVAAGAHFACFIDQLKARAAAPDFNLPADFPTATEFGSLEISSSQSLSVLGLRGTVNQRGEWLMTTTPVADLRNAPSSGPMYFPQFVDGGGYTTSLVLLNTSTDTEIGNLQILDDRGTPLIVKPVGGTPDSSFRYTIPPGGAFRFQTDGSPAEARIGWVRLTPVYNQTPIGSGVFSYNPGSILVSESGIPGATSTTHARIYVDLSRNHNTGLAIANVDSTPANIVIKALRADGTTAVGASLGPLQLAVAGHDAKFADQLIAGLPQGFTGVLDISSATPFAALTLRSLMNERGEFLMTTFPIADANVTAPPPYFPQVADGGGYTTEFILLISPTPGWGAGAVLYFYSEDGTAWKTEP
jgi:hypothetical protein